MELFQICKARFSDDLSGASACMNGGRWNNVGKSALYTAQNRSLAMAEQLVHLSPEQLDDAYVMVVLFVPDEVFLQSVDKNNLPADWCDNQPVTQAIGDAWLAAKSSLLLRVPSAVVNNDYNVILNPAHPDMPQVRIIAQEPFTFDPRLAKSHEK